MDVELKMYKTPSGKYKWKIIANGKVIARSDKVRSCAENKKNFNLVKKVIKYL